MGKQAPLHTADGNTNGRSPMKGNWQHPTKLPMYAPFDRAVPFLGIYSEDTTPAIQKYIRVRLFITTLFLFTKYASSQVWI